MKKVYETPCCFVFAIRNEQVLCSSVGSSIDDLQEDNTLIDLFN